MHIWKLTGCAWPTGSFLGYRNANSSILRAGETQQRGHCPAADARPAVNVCVKKKSPLRGKYLEMKCYRDVVVAVTQQTVSSSRECAVPPTPRSQRSVVARKPGNCASECTCGLRTASRPRLHLAIRGPGPKGRAEEVAGREC